MLTELREGTSVVDQSGDMIGAIERFVVDPTDYRVTHIVVEKGMLFTSERVIPVDALERGDGDDRLQLKAGIEADRLPAFEEHHYLDLGAEPPTATDQPIRYPASAWAYPTLGVPGFPAYPTIEPTAVAVETTRNVPEGSLVVSEGTDVISGDGDSIGKVKEVGTDHNGELAYVIVDPGWFRSERLVPGHWVIGIDDDGVHLSLTTRALKRHDRDRI